MRIQMRFQWKVVALVFAVVVITATAIIWRTQNQVVADKLNFVADSSMKQTAPLKRLVEEKLADAQRELVRFAGSRAVSGPGRETDFGPFDVIALIETNGSSPAATWTERGASARPESWPAGHDLALLKSLPYAKVRDGQRYWVRVADARGSAVFAIVVAVEVKAHAETAAPTAANLPEAVGTSVPRSRSRAYIVGFTTQNPLASITEDFIGSISNVYVVDDRGYVASHVDKSYNGALFTEDPIVAEFTKGQKTNGTGRYEDLQSRPVLAHFEKVDDTNLTVVLSTPIRAVTAGTDDHLQTAVFTAIGVGLLAALVAWFAGGLLAPPSSGPVYDLGASGLPTAFSREDDDAEPFRSIRPSSPAPSPLSVAAPVDLPPAVAAVKNEASLQNERKLAFEAFHQGLANQLRDPLLSIIGHAQLVRANAGEASEKIQSHVESIERDARNAKESLDRLRFFEEADLPLEADESFDLDEAVMKALEAKDIDLQAAGVKVERMISSVPRLRGRASDFTLALGHMIDNAIEAMRDRPVRRLTIKTEVVGDHATLSVADTGIGMPRDVKNRAFEPFFKNFESPLRMGLGLSFVHAAAHRAEAKCEIDSMPGDGTVVKLKFPLPVAKADLPPPTAAQEIALASEAIVTPKAPTVAPPAVPRVPPPMAAKPPVDSDEDEAFKVVSSGAGSTLLGGRGPITEGLPLPPMPYPKLEREMTSEEILESQLENPIEDAPAIDWDSTVAIKIPRVTENPIQEAERSVIHEFGHDSMVKPAPQPSAPEAIAPESIASESPSSSSALNEPPPIEAAPKPFRVRIRPPKSRGPSSQA